ncbi:MAG: shikimate kinase AroK [Aquisalimonadaceae bacterium]
MQHSRLFLIGPMGAGKSTIGKRLAKTLGLRFLDSDREIEAHTGVDLPRIFDIEGEAGFRRREEDMIEQLTTRDGIVLATGGGAVLAENNRLALRSRGVVIYLQTSVAEQLRRTRRDRRRPLLMTDDPEARLNQLMEQREPLYRDTATITVNTDGGAITAVVQQIVNELKRLDAEQ